MWTTQNGGAMIDPSFAGRSLQVTETIKFLLEEHVASTPLAEHPAVDIGTNPVRPLAFVDLVPHLFQV